MLGLTIKRFHALPYFPSISFCLLPPPTVAMDYITYSDNVIGVQPSDSPIRQISYINPVEGIDDPSA
jgi:hypothetical protein